MIINMILTISRLALCWMKKGSPDLDLKNNDAWHHRELEIAH
jgi:hypothetical protein